MYFLQEINVIHLKYVWKTTMNGGFNEMNTTHVCMGTHCETKSDFSIETVVNKGAGRV